MTQDNIFSSNEPLMINNELQNEVINEQECTVCIRLEARNNFTVVERYPQNCSNRYLNIYFNE